MTLKEHIDDIRDALRRNEFPNEAAVAQGIVGRLLTSMTWPWWNPRVVIPEYSVGRRRVDFALCHPALKPMIFIEVKQVGQSDGAERQLFEYAFHAGVPIAVLTDGQKWQFFHPSGRGNYEERRVYTLDLIETDREESVSRLNRYLNYESVCTGKSSEAIEDDYQNVLKQRQIEENLPEAWNKLMEEKDESLLDLVAEKVESLCGYKPTGDQVWYFLESLKRMGDSGKASPPILGEEGEKEGRKGRQGNEQVSDYLIPVIKRVRSSKDHTEAFHSVAEKLGVKYQTVSAQCTRSLGLSTRQFTEYVQTEKIIQIIKNKYPEHRELITRELGGSVRQSV